MKSRSEIALAWFVVLTMLGYTGDIALHVSQATLWIYHIAGTIAAYRAAGATPGATLLALAKTLPWAFYLIPLLAGVSVGTIWWAVVRYSKDDSGIQRGARVVGSDEGKRMVRQQRRQQ